MGPPPPAFEFIQREALRPDPNLSINPLTVPRRFLLRASVGEEFDDNVRFAPGGRKQGDLSTLGSLSGQYRFEDPRTFVQTANSTNFRYSPRFSDRQGMTFTDINVVAGHQLTPRFRLGLSETFVQVNDLGQSNLGAPGIPTATQSGRSRGFIRNALSPQAFFSLTPQTSFTARYSNTVVLPEGGTAGTTSSTGSSTASSTGSSTTNTFGGTLSHLFTEITTGTLTYSHLNSRQSRSQTLGDDVTAGLSHRLNLRTVFTLNASASFRNPDISPNQTIFTLSAGANRQLSPTLSAGMSVGLQDLHAGGRDAVSQSFSLSLSKFGLHYRLLANASMATQESISQANDVGLTRNQTLRVNYVYFPSQVWYFTLGGVYTRTDFTLAQRASALGIGQSTIDKLYTLTATADYRLIRWLFLRLSYTLLVRDSTQIGRDTSDNRVSLSIVTELSR